MCVRRDPSAGSSVQLLNASPLSVIVPCRPLVALMSTARAAAHASRAPASSPVNATRNARRNGAVSTVTANPQIAVLRAMMRHAQKEQCVGLGCASPAAAPTKPAPWANGAQPGVAWKAVIAMQTAR